MGHWLTTATPRIHNPNARHKPMGLQAIGDAMHQKLLADLGDQNGSPIRRQVYNKSTFLAEVATINPHHPTQWL